MFFSQRFFPECFCLKEFLFFSQAFFFFSKVFFFFSKFFKSFFRSFVFQFSTTNIANVFAFFNKRCFFKTSFRMHGVFFF